MIAVGVAGERVQDDDADPRHGKNHISEQGQLRVALLAAPVVLRQKADHDAGNGGGPDDDLQGGGRLHLIEGELPDIEQQDIEYRHGDRGHLKADAELSLDLLAAALERTDHAGDEVKCVAAAKDQGQNAVQDKQGAALCQREEDDPRDEVKGQIANVKYRLHQIRYAGFAGVFCHGAMVSFLIVFCHKCDRLRSFRSRSSVIELFILPLTIFSVKPRSSACRFLRQSR